MTVQPEREQDMATIRLTITLPEGEMETVRAIQETYGLETNSAAIWFALKTWQAAIAKGLMPKFLGKVPVAYLIPKRLMPGPNDGPGVEAWVAPKIGVRRTFWQRLEDIRPGAILTLRSGCECVKTWQGQLIRLEDGMPVTARDLPDGWMDSEAKEIVLAARTGS
jgi:hypothetical protein